MADNCDQRHGWSNILAPVTSALGFGDSRSERKPPHVESAEASDQPRSRQANQSNSPKGSRLETPMETGRRARPGSPRPEGGRARNDESLSIAKECASTIYSLQKSVEARHRPVPVAESSEASDMKSIINSYKTALRQKDDEIAALREEMEELRGLSYQWENAYHSTKRELAEAKGHIAHQTRSLEDAHRRFQKGEEEMGKLRQLLDHRTEEVKVAQAFMTTADKYSVTEVCNIVEQLNDEIYQCSMNLSDAMIRQSPVSLDPTSDACGEAQRFFRSWSREILTRLEDDMKGGDPDTTVFDCIAQYTLVDWLYRSIRGFCQDKNINRYFLELWDDVSMSHETSISRNWLAITCATLKSRRQPVNRAGLFRRLGHLMVASGREGIPTNRLDEIIGEKLDLMEATALQIKEAITEGVLSTHVEVFSCPMNAEFRSTTMRSAFANPSRGSGGGEESRKDLVVCPTGLGLRRIAWEASVTDPSRMRKRQDVLLKAKALLNSTLNE